ncbi:hypothetical protein Cgig2_031381 [Carnegiea gigantea]|uniref:Uncharacterized protein n=1 Tax=Carnegiea gigantea TaxID=171969 RepID=A0A9Q1JPG0_9CARY|nr:hypothetical protein Cgig2_031381 [Carnegiea gigantea]
MGEYALSEVIWRFLFRSLDDFQLKLLGPVNEVQLNSCAILVQVDIYVFGIGGIAKWDAMDNGDHYDACKLLAGINEEEKEKHKAVEIKAECLMCCVRDLEGRLKKYEDIPTTDKANGGDIDREGGQMVVMEKATINDVEGNIGDEGNKGARELGSGCVEDQHHDD